MFCPCSYIKLEKHFQHSSQFIAAKQHLTRKACLSVPPHPSSLTPHKISYIINHCHFAAYITTLGLCDWRNCWQSNLAMLITNISIWEKNCKLDLSLASTLRKSSSGSTTVLVYNWLPPTAASGQQGHRSTSRWAAQTACSHPKRRRSPFISLLQLWYSNIIPCSAYSLSARSPS